MRQESKLTTFIAAWYIRLHLLQLRTKYAGMQVNEVKRMKDLEIENNKLKRIMTEKLLEIEAIKDVI
jgi:hypothetical protein